MPEGNDRRLKIIIACCVSFVIISYLVFRTNLPKFPNIFLYNLIIIACLHEIGFYRALFFLGGATFFTILISISSTFQYVWNVPVFFITFLITDDRIRKHSYLVQIIEMRIEEVKERINLLTDEHNRHKREFSALDKKEKRYDLLKDVIYTLSSTLSLEEITAYIIDNAMDIVGKADAGLLFLVDTDRQELNLSISKIGSAFERPKLKKGDILDEWVFKQRQGLLVEDIKKDFRFSNDKFDSCERQYRSVISCPFMEERKILGILRLESPKPFNFNSEDLRLLDIICDLGAVSLQNAGLYKKTHELAIRDGLTGLYLRRHFLSRMNEELSRSLRGGLHCSFMMIDIDNFKNYNDEYGHVAGDIVLKSIAMVLTEIVDVGIICRYGGEEFSILLPETPKKKALVVADDIRRSVKKRAIMLRRVKTFVTVSIGAAGFPDDARAQDELIFKADNRLYRAKREGKDRVIGD